MKILYTFLGLVMALSISAQDAFHRIYPFNSPDSIQIVTDGIQLTDGGFATIGRDFVLSNGMIDQSFAATVSRYDTKGDLLYSNDIYLADSTYLYDGGKIIQMDNGNLAFSAAIVGGDEGVAVVILDQLSSEPIWSKVISNDFTFGTQIDNYPEDQLLVSSYNFSSDSIMMTMMTSTGDQIWSKKFNSMGVTMDNSISDLYVSLIDSSIFVTGRSNINDGVDYYLSKLDENGDQIWSNYYSSTEASLVSSNIVEMPDSTIYVAGTYFLDVNGLIEQNRWITKHDKNGNIVWTKGIAEPSFFTEGKGLSIKGENIVMAAETDDDLGNPSPTNFPIIIEIDTAGVLVNSQSYKITNSNLKDGALHTTSDDGVVLFTTFLTDGYVTEIIKTRPDLTTNCSEAIVVSLEDIELSQMSILWISTDETDLDTLETDLTSVVNLYDIPTISPSAIQWCPNEPIIDTLDATPSPLPDGTITYEWMGPGVDGAITPFVVGMEEGEYMVTVTINDKHCYTLCDTVNISRYTEPSVSIGQDFSQFCQFQTVGLIGQISPGAEPYQTTEWSTGETNPVITVSEEGTYTLTVVDACMETAIATANVAFPPELMSLQITTLIGDDCDDFMALLTATTNVDDDPESTFTWTNADGEEIGMGRIIEVNQPGTYTVRVDNCTDSLTDMVTVSVPVENSSLQWPKVFFPRGEEEENRNFGPVNPCGADVTNYSLKIFNRWGNEVFTSDNIAAEWNGQHGGSDSATAVYVWVAEYTLNGEAVTDKGDVTLLR